MQPHSLDFACPVCNVQPREKCLLLNGTPRFESHVERKWIARDHVHEPVLMDPMQEALLQQALPTTQ
jgi:hypothetical protein